VGGGRWPRRGVVAGVSVLADLAVGGGEHRARVAPDAVLAVRGGSARASPVMGLHT
jgi:hypothetical protein